MLMVVVLHANTRGAFSYTEAPVDHYLTKLSEFFCIVAVNVFVMITGFFQSQKRFRISKLLILESEVLFYSVVIYIVFCCIGKAEFWADPFRRAYMPVMSKAYWFVTAYVLLYCLSPFLNMVIGAISRKQHKALLITIMAVSFVWNDLLHFNKEMMFYDGYSHIWFIVLYLTAAYIRKYGAEIKHPLLGYLLGSIFLFIYDIFLGKVFEDYLEILNSNITMSYCSIIVYFTSVCLFSFFSGIRITRGKRIIETVSPLTFAVYLIHENNYVKQVVWPLFGLDIKSNLLLKQTFAVFTIFTVCIVIEYVRARIFSLIIRKDVWKKADDTFDRFMIKLKNEI